MADALAHSIRKFDWLVAISTENRLYAQDSKLAPWLKLKSLAAAKIATVCSAARRRCYTSPQPHMAHVIHRCRQRSRPWLASYIGSSPFGSGKAVL